MHYPHNSYTTTNDSGHGLYANSVQLIQYMKIKTIQVIARFIGEFKYSYIYIYNLITVSRSICTSNVIIFEALEFIAGIYEVETFLSL